jgi:hypothetical protein
VSQSQFWDFKLDENGNMLFKDDTQSYVERFKNFKDQMKIERNYDDEDIKFDWTDKDALDDTPQTVDSTVEGTSEGTPAISTHDDDEEDDTAALEAMPEIEFTFEEEPIRFKETYLSLPTIKQRHLFYARFLATEEQNIFFSGLDEQEKARLYPHLTEEEKGRILSVHKPSETLPPARPAQPTRPRGRVSLTGMMSGKGPGQ